MSSSADGSPPSTAEANYGLGALDAVTGGTRPFAANQVVRNAGADAAINSLISVDGVVYGSGYTFGSGGNFEGIPSPRTPRPARCTG